MDDEKPANWRPTQQEAVEAWLTAQLEGQPVPLNLQDDHELTPIARARGWRIFELNMAFLTAHDSLAVRSFVAMSVGLHPYFANETWVWNDAIPYFQGRREDIEGAFEDDDKDACAQAVTKLETFIERVSVALSALKANTLPCTHIGSGGPETTAVVFWAFAQSKGWGVPAGMADTTHQQAPQRGTGTSKVWTDERKAEARAYREKHGLKKTAEHYSVSAATISKHIPAGNPKAKKATPFGGLGCK